MVGWGRRPCWYDFNADAMYFALCLPSLGTRYDGYTVK